MNRSILIALLTLTLVAGLAGAQDEPAVEPATQPAQEPQPQPFVVTVTAVAGPVQAKDCTDESAGWTPVAVGDQLGELTVIRTGFGGSAELAFGENSTARVEPCSQIGVRQFRPSAETTQTRVNLKYGQLEVQVERERGPNDYAVETPVGTLAARGSGNVAGFTDFGLQLDASSGQWLLTTGAGDQGLVGGEGSNQWLAKWFELLAKRLGIQLGPQGLTPEELAALLNNSGGLGISGFIGPNGTFGPTLFEEIQPYGSPPQDDEPVIVPDPEPQDPLIDDDRWYNDDVYYPNGYPAAMTNRLQ